MKTHVTGQPVLDELRQHALTALLGHPLFTEAEHQRATHFAYKCEDIARLTRWTTSVRAEIARREAHAARQRCHRASQKVLRHLRAPRFRGHYPLPPRPRPTWVLGAPLPAQADRRAGTVDRRAATRFQPADALPLANLSTRQSR